MVPTHTQTYSTQLPFITFLCLLSECVRSSGPVRADNSGVHRQLIAAGGHGERQGALALLGQLQRGRGRQQPRQRGRRRRRRSLREESADTLKSQKLTVCHLLSPPERRERAMRAGSHRHGVLGESWEKYPAVQSELDGSQSVQLQPGPAGHRPAAGSPTAIPGNFTAQ